MQSYNSVDDYIKAQENWTDCLVHFRRIINSSELKEEVKWGMPTYTLYGKNVVGFSAFKNWCGIWFFQGVFLKDEKKMLLNAQEGKTKGLRQWRFGSREEIISNETLIDSYLKEAIKNQRQGLEIKPERKPLIIPEQLKEALASDSELSESFDKLKEGVKKEFAEYITEAKREATKQKRLLKISPMIKNGIGLGDKYR